MARALREFDLDPKLLNEAIRGLTEGRQNSVGDVTLAAGATSTVVPFENCSRDCRVFLFPQTANAAGALATTYIPLVDIQQRGFTIRHANAGSTDRTFSFLCIGG